MSEREAKIQRNKVLRGEVVREHMTPKMRKQCRDEGRGSYAMTRSEAIEAMGLRGSKSAGTAKIQKMERQGWTYLDGRGGYRKTTRG